VVADLTLRAREKRDGAKLENLIGEIGEGRKDVLILAKDWIGRAKESNSSREVGEMIDLAQESILNSFQRSVAKPLVTVMELRNAMEKTPSVTTDSPAVVLVGAPNVGKSSIVRKISSGLPEIADYPFTTRGMTLGHVEVQFDVGGDDHEDEFMMTKTQLCQVMDSPGLLSRPDEERNEMESLTLAAMQHLPTAVMYVMDLSGGAGDKCSSVEDQLRIRKEMRTRFPRRPWIDVVSKCDLGLEEGARDALEQILKDENARYFEVSTMNDTGVVELKDEVIRMLDEVRVVLDAMAAADATMNLVPP